MTNTNQWEHSKHRLEHHIGEQYKSNSNHKYSEIECVI